MLERLDRKLGIETLFWSFPVAFLLHDTEESLTAERFWRQSRESLPLPDAVKERIDPTTRQMFVAVSCVSFFVVLASCLAGSSPRRPNWRLAFFDFAVAALLLDALKHAAQTLLIRRYTPGVVTAVTVSLPFSAYGLYRLRAEGLAGERGLRRSLAVGGSLVVPLVLGAHAVGRLLTRR